MHLLRNLHLRCNPTSIISLSTLYLRACSRQRRCLISPRIGCQFLAWQGQKQWLHSSPGQDPSQNIKPPSSPSTVAEDSPTSKGTLSVNNLHGAVGETDPLQDKSIGLFQRFKKTFKQYGKVMVTVHVLTSSAWIGTFYYAAMKGVNVVPFLEFIGLPESIVNILKNSESGNVLTAYAMYKIATPVRYMVTLGGTSISVKYLRKYGYLSTPPPPLVKEYIQERFTEKIEETRDKISEKMEETKDRITEKIQETKDTLSFRKKKEE